MRGSSNLLNAKIAFNAPALLGEAGRGEGEGGGRYECGARLNARAKNIPEIRAAEGAAAATAAAPPTTPGFGRLSRKPSNAALPAPSAHLQERHFTGRGRELRTPSRFPRLVHR